MIEFPKDFREFLPLLNSKEVEYLVIGSYAVGYSIEHLLTSICFYCSDWKHQWAGMNRRPCIIG